MLRCDFLLRLFYSRGMGMSRGMRMRFSAFSERDLQRRLHWVAEVGRRGRNYLAGFRHLESELVKEVENFGIEALLQHIRLCGVVPECFPRGSGEERLYGKYSDAVIHEAFKALGLDSRTQNRPGDAPGVECACDQFSFVAESVAFRMSRVARNQKDFDLRAIHRWKQGRPFGMLVAPINQLPFRFGQIYRDAALLAVLVCSYSHLAVLVRYAQQAGSAKAIALLHEAFRVVRGIPPAKNAEPYWQALNRTFLAADARMPSLWREEKAVLEESISLGQAEALRFLDEERQGIEDLPRQEAIEELLHWRKLNSRVQAVQQVRNNGLVDHDQMED